MRLPVTLIVDDGACINPMCGIRPDQKRELLIPNSFTRAFADLCRRYGVKGKFSVLPMPSALGRIDDRLNGVPHRHLAEFLGIIRRQIAPRFDITPELLTHLMAYDLKTGRFLHRYEDEWVRQASAPELTDYLSLAFRILRQAGLRATGVTSPWNTGIHNEADYAQAIGRAYDRVFRGKFTWYFLHCLGASQPRWPWIAWRDRRRGLTVVSVPALTDDPFWAAQDQPTPRRALRCALQGVDRLITRDGRRGRLRDLFDQGYPLILLTHWQSLFAEGRAAGLAGFEELVSRINRIFGARTEWVTLSQLARTAVGQHEAGKS